MGKFNKYKKRILSNESESDNDSLELINPVLNLSLEHIDQTISLENFHHQSNQFDSNDKLEKVSNSSRYQPYQHIKKYPNYSQSYDMKYLKSLPYLEYSTTKESQYDDIQLLFFQINQSIQQIFSKYLKKTNETNRFICNRRFH